MVWILCAIFFRYILYQEPNLSNPVWYHVLSSNIDPQLVPAGNQYLGRAQTRKDVEVKQTTNSQGEPVLSQSAKTTLWIVNNALLIWKQCDWPQQTARVAYESLVIQVSAFLFLCPQATHSMSVLFPISCWFLLFSLSSKEAVTSIRLQFRNFVDTNHEVFSSSNVVVAHFKTIWSRQSTTFHQGDFA